MNITRVDPVGLVISILALLTSIAGIIVSIAGVVVSYIVARKYGDLAAVKASRRLHEEDMREARLTAFRSLLNEVRRIRAVVIHNSRLDRDSHIESVTRLPVAAFETTFVSGKPGLDASQELLQAVTDYLACADSINSLIDVYPSSIAGYGTGTIPPKSIVHEIVEACEDKESEDNPYRILERLKTYLAQELSSLGG